MRQVIPLILATAAALSPICAHSQANSEKRTTVSSSVAKLITPILDAHQEALEGPRPMSEEKGSPLWRSYVLTGKLLGNKSPASDEALVVLLYYYIGESTGGDQLQEIICRGNRMLPYLRKYQSFSPQIPRRHYSKDMFLEPQVVRENFKDAIDEINSGHSASACESQQ